jgi:hypothetical protein
MNGETRNSYNILMGNIERIKHMENLGADSKIKLKYIFEKLLAKM